MLDFTGRIRPHSDVVSTEMENREAVLLHLKTKKYYSLNETGLRIWQMLGKGNTPAQIIEGLQGKFNITLEKATDSVIALLIELMNEQLVVADHD